MPFPQKAITLLLAIYFMQSGMIAAQQTTCANQLHFLITEEHTNYAIPGALLSLQSQQTQTDAAGYALFTRLCLDTERLTIQVNGYTTVNMDIPVVNGDTLRINLQPLTKTLDAIEVTSHRQALQTTTSVTTLRQDDLDKLKGQNLAQMLSSVAGVSILQTGATIGKPVVNGMHSNRLLILNNGIRQEGQQWGSEHAPEIDPFIAQNITVVKGAEAIRYGAEAIGGVVIIEPAPLPSDSSLHAEVNLVGATNGRSGTASALVSGNLKSLPALAWRIQGTSKKSGNYKTADYFMDNTGSEELNYSATLGYTKRRMGIELFYSHFNTTLGIFKGSHVGSREDLFAAIAHGDPFYKSGFSYVIDAPKQHVRHDLFKATGHLHLSSYFHLNFQYGFQNDDRKEYDRRRGGRSSTPSLDFNLQTHTVDGSLEYYDGKQWKATIGINGMIQQNASAADLYVSPLIPDYNSSGSGVYAIGKLLKNDFVIEAGVRYDYKYLTALGYRGTVLYGGTRNFHNFSGSVGAVYHVNSLVELRSNIGTAWRPPTVNELYSSGLHHGAAAIEYGDSSLTSEKSIKWINSLHFQNQANWLSIDADIYANYFDNYIYLMPTGAFSENLRGAFPIFETRSTNARFLGSDLSATFRFLTYLNYTVKGALIRAKDITAQRFLPMIPADKLEQTIGFHYDPVPFLNGTYVQLSHVFVRKQTRNEPNSDFAPPPRPYHLLSLNMGTQINSGKHHLTINFGIDNLTNTSYKDYMNRFRYYAHDLGRSYTLRLTYRI